MDIKLEEKKKTRGEKATAKRLEFRWLRKQSQGISLLPLLSYSKGVTTTWLLWLSSHI